MKILVIDDEKPTLSMFNLFLTAYGYEVFTAEDGEKGLAVFKEVAPDMVFTDIRMPGIDGLEVLRRIRKMDTDTQVIIITGHGDMEKAVEALDLDASDFINKPVERQALNSALARAEKRRAMPRRMPFEFSVVKNTGFITATLKGKLSGENEADIQAALNRVMDPDVTRVSLTADDTLSITRSGIAALMAVIRDLQRKQAAVAIENLSYNYARVFRMAGIDKLADLIEEVLPD